MRVVLSTPRFGWGGTATRCMSLAAGLEERGHEVVIFCKPGSTIHAAAEGRFACEPILHGVDFPPPAIFRCRRAFRRHRTQVVLSLVQMDLRLTAAAARLSGVRVVAHRAELRPFSRLPHRRLLIDRLPHQWVANRETMLRTGPWLEPDDVTTVYFGMDPEPYTRAEAADLGLPGDAVVVGFVGRLVIEKGLAELAEAWRALAPSRPELHLVVAGEGPWERPFRERLGDAPRVHLLGFRDDVARVMKATDFLVMPSREESFGIAAIEAMAAGRPLVATRSGGLPEIVEDGRTGRMIPLRDAAALAAAIEELADDPELRARLGAAGPEAVAERFTVERMVDGYEEVLAAEVARAES